MTYLGLTIGDNSTGFADTVAKQVQRFIPKFIERIGESPNVLLVNPDDMERIPKPELHVGDVHLIVIPNRLIQKNCIGLERITQ